ncbi:MAG: hypothetical protein R3C14_04720 [Caldilineaceae bacterium]
MNDQEKFQYTIAITEVVNRYFAALDQKQFDATPLRQIFADDAKIVRSNGAITTGPKEIGDSHRHSCGWRVTVIQTPLQTLTIF